MKMKNLGYYNGRYDLMENMQIPMNDRGYYFGDGVYDASYMENNRIFDLDSHIRRFFNSAKLIGIQMDFSQQRLRELLEELAKKVEGGGYLAYWQVTRGTGIRRHYSEGLKPNLAVMFLPSRLRGEQEGMRVKTYPDKRYEYCNVKSLNLIPNVLGAAWAERDGCDEILFIRDGIVTECAHSNVHMIKDGIVYTHPADQHILPGIARAHMLAACSRLGIPYQEKLCSLEEFLEADEVFITSSATPCSRVEEIDGKMTRHSGETIFLQLQDYVYREMHRELTLESED